LAKLKHEYIIDYKTAWIQNQFVDINKSIGDEPFSNASSYDGYQSDIC
jgi:hypothetical protein